jgi:hypothetical protein
MATAEGIEREAYLLASELAELADETLTSEGDPKLYEQEMETLRRRMTLALLAFCGASRRES